MLDLEEYEQQVKYFLPITFFGYMVIFFTPFPWLPPMSIQKFWHLPIDLVRISLDGKPIPLILWYLISARIFARSVSSARFDDRKGKYFAHRNLYIASIFLFPLLGMVIFYAVSLLSQIFKVVALL